MMFDFLSLNPEAFGIDISDMSIKIIKLKKRRDFFNIEYFAEQKIKPGIVVDGEIKNAERLSEIIKEMVFKTGGKKIKTNYVIASLPEKKAFLQVISLPLMSRDDLKSAVVYEAENYVPLPIEEIYLDSQIIPSPEKNPVHFNVLIAAFSKKIVDPYVFCLKEAGLNVKALETESSAISRALIEKEKALYTHILIDFGLVKTNFVIFSGGSLRFSSAIPVSSSGFTKIISDNLGVNLVKAEEMKVKYGLLEGMEKRKFSSQGRNIGQGGSEKRKVFDSLVPALVDLTQQIRKHIEYYQAHFVGKEKSSGDERQLDILLSGGGANLKGLSEYLSMELNLPVGVGNPLANMVAKGKVKKIKISAEELLGYTTAIGLAMRGISEE
ncbi:MAG: hypothetical protein COZ91_01640 [Candidatus Nealsonbacteria bacterium CG_4_8_14_3_um_filter_39_7]|nr:MAG: hypothetical protein COZ91_01640 [Candidatus Nealsonbacteria bacterium CG_4_8_14_3_um_filter_39_7]